MEYLKALYEIFSEISEKHGIETAIVFLLSVVLIVVLWVAIKSFKFKDVKEQLEHTKEEFDLCELEKVELKNRLYSAEKTAKEAIVVMKSQEAMMSQILEKAWPEK